jgi:predicted HTH transcriptional regulator
MHRDLQSNMPLRIYEFAHHLEITNAGGLYGNARPENFPTINDYRNPLIASAMKTMGYVNMFNRGVGQVQTDLKQNGNPPAEFVVDLITAFRVNVGDVPSLSQAVTSLSQDEEKVATSNEKVASSAQKVATSNEKDASSIQKVATYKKNRSAEEMAIYILEYCATWRSMDEIAQFAERDKNYIRNKVLPRLTEKLEKEFPDVPNHPKQRYKTKQKEGEA